MDAKFLTCDSPSDVLLVTMETPCWLEAPVRNVTAVEIQILTWSLKTAMRSLASVGIAYATPPDSSVNTVHLATMGMPGEPRTVQVRCCACCSSYPASTCVIGAGSLSVLDLDEFILGKYCNYSLDTFPGQYRNVHPILLGVGIFIKTNVA